MLEYLKSPLPVYLVSSCLVGLKTRYDGKCKPCLKCQGRLSGKIWLPVCPEQLGGLSTPRVAADLSGGNGHDVLNGRARVVTRNGDDVSRNFIAGALQVLQIADSFNDAGVFLKSRSPSCGLTPTPGVTAALLSQHGYDLLEF